MPYDRFMIAPFNSGLQTNLRPWLIPEDAFETLRNVFVFRGRVRKRFGELLTGTGATTPETRPLFSRLRVPLTGGAGVGTTDGAGNATGTVPGTHFRVGQLFSIGTQIFTVNALGNPAVMLSTDPAVTTHTFDTTTGAYVFAGATPNTQIYFYPAEPVMGLTQYEVGPINNLPSYGFDTQFAYVFSGGSWIRSANTGLATNPLAPVWHGTDLDFFWATNWVGADPSLVVMFVTNFFVNIGLGLVTDDPIWSFNGTAWTPLSYSPDATVNNPANLQPFTVTQTVAGSDNIIANYVQQARIILPFKNRLLLLNTVENNANGATASPTGITPANYVGSTNTRYPQRVRFSHEGSPFSDSAWLEPNQSFTNGANPQVFATGGGFEDATTDEEIIGAEFIKDRLIVFFERSTWELVYTGNQVGPFIWQKLNTELGSESTFSTVSFDKVILAIGNTGVHACNGSNVERIDNKIPDLVFTIVNKDLGVQRVAGIRDYFAEMVYWTFPSVGQQRNTKFPTQILAYNYQNGSWATFDDCITTFGYFEQQTDTTWATIQGTWQQANFTWVTGITAANFRNIIAGNQQGFVFTIQPPDIAGSVSRNAPVMQITNMANSSGLLLLTVIDHTLNDGNYADYVAIENAQGITGTVANPINGQIFEVVSFVGPNQILVGKIGQFISFTGTYTGGGTLTRVSNINILSKQWNPYVDKSRDFYLSKIDFGVEKTTDGQIQVDYYPSASELSMLAAGFSTSSIMGNLVLETSPYPSIPLEQEQNRLWHPIYFQTEGECIQLRLFFNPDQIENPAIAWSDFQLEGMILHTLPTTPRLQ